MLCHRSARRPVKRFGRYVEKAGEGLPERTDAETTDGPSSCDLRQGVCPRLQRGTYAKHNFEKEGPVSNGMAIATGHTQQRTTRGRDRRPPRNPVRQHPRTQRTKQTPQLKHRR